MPGTGEDPLRLLRLTHFLVLLPGFDLSLSAPPRTR